MPQKLMIGKREAIWLIVNAICAKIFLNYPRAMAEIAGTGAWVLTIFFSLISVITVYIILRLYSKFDGKDIIDIGEYIGGTSGRVIVGSIIAVFIISLISITLREFSENIKVISLVVSPLSFIMLFFLVSMIAGSYFGIESIARTCAIIPPVIAVGYLLIIIAVSPYCDIRNLSPVLGNGAHAVFGKGFLRISVFSEVIFLFLIPPFIKTYEEFKKIGIISTLLSAGFLILSSLVYVMVFDYPTFNEILIPVYQEARLIDLGRFFRRLESFFVFIWSASAFIYLSQGFFYLTYILKKTFRLEYHKPLTLSCAILVFNLAMLLPNLISAVDVDEKYFGSWSWIISFVMVIVLLCVGRIVKRIREPSKKCSQS